jgi:hypothetical protein
MLEGRAVVWSAARETVLVTVVVSVSVSVSLAVVTVVAAVPMTTVAAGTAGPDVMGCGSELDAVCVTAGTILGTGVIALLVAEVVGAWDDSVLDAGAAVSSVPGGAVVLVVTLPSVAKAAITLLAAAAGLDVMGSDDDVGCELTRTSSIRSTDTVSNKIRAREVTASLSSLVAVAELGEGWRKK